MQDGDGPPPRFFPYSKQIRSVNGKAPPLRDQSYENIEDDEAMSARVARLLAEQEAIRALKAKEAANSTSLTSIQPIAPTATIAEPTAKEVVAQQSDTAAVSEEEWREFNLYRRAKSRIGIACPYSTLPNHSESSPKMSTERFPITSPIHVDNPASGPYSGSFPGQLEMPYAKAQEVISKQQEHLERLMEIAEHAQMVVEEKEQALLEANKALEIERRSNTQLATYLSIVNQRLSELRQEHVAWKRVERARMAEERKSYEENAHAALLEALQVGKDNATDNLGSMIQALLDQKAGIEAQINQRQGELEAVTILLDDKKKMLAEEVAKADRAKAEQEWLTRAWETKKILAEQSAIADSEFLDTIPEIIHNTLHEASNSSPSTHPYLSTPEPPLRNKVEHVIRSSIEAEISQSKLRRQREFAAQVLNESVNPMATEGRASALMSVNTNAISPIKTTSGESGLNSSDVWMLHLAEGKPHIDDPLLNAYVADALTRTQLQKAAEKQQLERKYLELAAKAGMFDASNEQRQLDAATHKASMAAKDNEILSLKETVQRFSSLLDKAVSTVPSADIKTTPPSHTQPLSSEEAKAKYNKLLDALASAPYTR